MFLTQLFAILYFSGSLGNNGWHIGIHHIRSRGNLAEMEFCFYCLTFGSGSTQSQIALGLASGIAALLLSGGAVYSRLKVPININELSVCNISKKVLRHS